MFAVCSDGMTVERTNDIQAIFDIVYNTTGEHELAMQSYMKAENMVWGNKAEISVAGCSVLLVCYNETIHDVNNKGDIVKKQFKVKPLSVSEVVRHLRHSYERGIPAKLVAYTSENWVLYVTYDLSSKNIRYIAEYIYSNGKHGTVELAIVKGQLAQNRNDVKVPKAVTDKVIQLNNKL